MFVLEGKMNVCVHICTCTCLYVYMYRKMESMSGGGRCEREENLIVTYCIDFLWLL